MGWTAWPTASGATWEWVWTAYPAVWAALIVALGVYAGGIAWLRRRPGAILDVEPARRKLLLFAAGVLVTWLALDWPFGGLAGNLFWVRTAQYLVLSLVAAPLLLLGTPPVPTPAPRLPHFLRAIGRGLTRPIVAAPLFGATLFMSFLPAVVQAIEPDPVAAAALRGAWLTVGLIYWWPLVGPGPEDRRLPYLGAIGYLVFPFLLPKAPGAFYVFATQPIYEPYAQGGQAWGLSPLSDQGIAGFMLWIIGSIMVLVAAYLVFRRWGEEDRALIRADSLALPADPDALALLMAVPGGWQALEQLVTIIDDSLPEEHHGASLSFRIRRRRMDREWREQVALVVHLAGSERDQELLYNRVTAQFAAHMTRYDEERRDAIGERLAFEVERVGARVQ